MSGNGWLCHKVRILFWNWPKSSPFFHAECASCGVLAGDSGASVAENRGEFWEISVIVSVFLLRFGGGRSAVDLCSQIGGRGATKKGASDSTRAVGCTEKGDHGAEIRRKLVLRSSASGCRSPRGRKGGAVFVVRPWPTAVGRRGAGECCRFRVRKGGRLTGWDDYLWVYFSYSLMYSITRSMASGRMSLMRGLLTQSYTMG